MDVKEEGIKRQQSQKPRQDGGLGGCGERGQREIRDEAERALKVGKSFNTDEQSKCILGSGSRGAVEEGQESQGDLANTT